MQRKRQREAETKRVTGGGRERAKGEAARERGVSLLGEWIHKKERDRGAATERERWMR